MDGIFYVLILACFTVLCSVLGYAVYCGLLHKITIETIVSPYEASEIAYKYRTGPYRKCGDLFKEVIALVPGKKPLGIYYDDPEEVPEDKLRYAVGCVLTYCSDEERHLLKGKGYRFHSLPKVNNITRALFPFKGMLSILLAIRRVWPAISAYIDAKQLDAHPWMEIYDDNWIHFIGPLDHQRDFYVPESGK